MAVESDSDRVFCLFLLSIFLALTQLTQLPHLPQNLVFALQRTSRNTKYEYLSYCEEQQHHTSPRIHARLCLTLCIEPLLLARCPPNRDCSQPNNPDLEILVCVLYDNTLNNRRNLEGHLGGRKEPTSKHPPSLVSPLGHPAKSRISPSRCELNDQIDLAHLRLDQPT